jgi:hypothetical protein
MTEIAEGVLVKLFQDLVNKEEKCTKKDAKNGWEARINQWGTNTDCDADRLYRNMLNKPANKPAEIDYRSGKEPFVKKSSISVLNKCDESHFPLQAHHIIPKNHLPTHSVCAFLAKKFSKNKEFKLKEDTYFDTDHAFNGYCLPYASALKEWDKARTADAKDHVAFKLMSQTKRQLHQGSHKEKQYSPESEIAEEELGIHDEVPGYLSKVNRLLEVVKSGAELHVKVCEVCKPNQDKKEINPRENVVRHVYQVSGLLKVLMDSNKIFVSERAFIYFQKTKIALEAPEWLLEE